MSNIKITEELYQECKECLVTKFGNDVAEAFVHQLSTVVCEKCGAKIEDEDLPNLQLKVGIDYEHGNVVISLGNFVSFIALDGEQCEWFISVLSECINKLLKHQGEGGKLCRREGPELN